MLQSTSFSPVTRSFEDLTGKPVLQNHRVYPKLSFTIHTDYLLYKLSLLRQTKEYEQMKFAPELGIQAPL